MQGLSMGGLIGVSLSSSGSAVPHFVPTRRRAVRFYKRYWKVGVRKRAGYQRQQDGERGN